MKNAVRNHTLILNLRKCSMEKVLDKAFKIIDELIQSPVPKGVTELAQELGLVKSNVHRLLNSLIELGLVRQVPDGEKYELTLKLWQMGNQVLSKTSVKNVAEPYMARLRDISHEDVFLSALEGSSVVYIHKLESNRVVRATLGPINPAYCSATGKALLAWQTEEAVREVMAGARRFTDDTIVDEEMFLTEMLRIRECGYSINRGEWRAGVRGVAAPVFDHDGKVVAAIGISGPAHRLGLELLEEFAPTVKAAAAEISAELGCPPR